MNRPPFARAVPAALCAVLCCSCASVGGRTGRARGDASGASRSSVPLAVNYCDWSDRFGTPESLETMRRLRALGVRCLLFVPTWYQARTDSTAIRALPGKTPSDAGLAADLRRARELGFTTGLKPHIDVEDGSPRSNIHFASREDFAAWWTRYRALIRHYAGMARAEGVEHLSIGCELSGVDVYPHTEAWLALIDELRAFFGPGGPLLTYSARHQNVANIGFLGRLDYIGVNAWPYFRPAPELSVDAMRRTWREALYFPETFGAPGAAPDGYPIDFFAFLRFVSAAHGGKPVALTEIGCQSKEGILSRPVDWWAPGTADVLVQAMFFEGFFEELLADRAARGPGGGYPLAYAGIWNCTIGPGGPRDTDYTPLNKPMTEAVLRRFAGTGRAGGR